MYREDPEIRDETSSCLTALSVGLPDVVNDAVNVCFFFFAHKKRGKKRKKESGEKAFVPSSTQPL